MTEVYDHSHAHPPAALSGSNGTTGIQLLSREIFSNASLTGGIRLRDLSLCAASGRPQHRAALPSVRSIALRRGVGGVVAWAWSNQASAFARRQISIGANMRPKKSGLWTIEFPSAISRNSRAAARQSNSWSTARAAMPLRRNAGCPARAARLRTRPSKFSPTSSRGSVELIQSTTERSALGLRSPAQGGI